LSSTVSRASRPHPAALYMHGLTYVPPYRHSTGIKENPLFVTQSKWSVQLLGYNVVHWWETCC